MKAVVCSVNSSYTQSSLSGAIVYREAQKAMPSSFAELSINTPKQTALATLYEMQGDIYLFSCYIWNIEYIRPLIADLKKVRKCTVIIGGPEVSHSPSDALCTIPEADFAVLGDAESVVERMLSFLRVGRMPDLYLGNVYSHRTIDKRPAPVNFDFATREFPYDEERLRACEGKIIYYETMRGCPHSCTFCTSGEDKTVSYVPLDRVKEELDIFIQREVPLVKFVDRCFNGNLSRAKEIVRYILKHNRSTCFHFEVNLDGFDEELTELLASAPQGYFQLEAGLQSINKRTLYHIKRRNNIPRFRETMKAILEKGNIEIYADLIALLPEETLESFFAGYDFLYYLGVHHLQLGFLKVLKSTAMHRDADRFGIRYSDTPPYEALRTTHISFAEKELLKKVAYLTDRYYNSGLFKETLQQISGAHDIAPHVFMTQFAAYFDEHDLWGSSLSQKSLYAHLAGFLKGYGLDLSSYLAYDYINGVSAFLPPFLRDSVAVVDKTEVFAFLRANPGFADSFETLKGKTPKAVFKSVAVYKFRDLFEGEPVLFIEGEDEGGVRAKKKHAILKGLYSYGL